MALALFGCQKEDLSPASENSGMRSKADQRTALRVYFDNGGSDYGCKGSGGNCLPDVVVTPHLRGAVNAVFGVVNSENPTAISHVFENYKDLLSRHMDREDVEGVIRGRYTVKSRGKDSNEPRYLLLYPADRTAAEPEVVYPFQ